MKNECIVSDMAPSNIILYENKISLIDLEGLASFEWLFNGKPQTWEAQNRNLNKCPSPFWRDMSKYLRGFLSECVGIKYDKNVDSVERLEELYNLSLIHI